jgi:16S rRNA (guanine966-N2)-methyltransferase
MRIVGGKFAGRNLASPNDFRVRPTAEPVRAAMLDRLAPVLAGARVLDLFAGTGALGLEALSRGAGRADFVETRPASLHALKANIVALRMREKTRVFKKDALPFAAGLRESAYQITFVDPPYESRMLDRVIEGWQRTRFSQILVAEHAATHVLPPGAEVVRFGDTSVSFYGLEL